MRVVFWPKPQFYIAVGDIWIHGCIMKLALGTAQMGLDYGVSNTSGKTSIGEAAEIISIAKRSNIDVIDTAIGYGESEKVLGHIGVDGFKVITKIPSIPIGLPDTKKWMFEQVLYSLDRLKINFLYGVLLHDTKILHRSDNSLILEALRELKQNSLVKKVGVSIYDPVELEMVINKMEVDIVQAPLNLIDRRLVETGWLDKLIKRGVEVHARSVFLQGLLLVTHEKIPIKFDRWNYLWNFWHKRLSDDGLDAKDECLRYVLSITDITKIIVGVQTAKQLEQLCTTNVTSPAINEWREMICHDEALINPSKWSSL